MATTGVIGRAGTPLDIKLGESPNIPDPIVNVEVQQIYNALHLLSNYMAVLRENLESADGQTPAESVRFRRTFWAPAAQVITAGSIVCSDTGGVYNGVLSKNPPVGAYINSGVTIGSTGSRALFKLEALEFGVALTSAAIGELVQIGVGPGILQVPNSKSGQLIWAVDSKSVFTTREANTVPQLFFGTRTFVNNGGVYLQNVIGSYYLPNTEFSYYRWEGYWLPGYPTNASGTYLYNCAFLYPVGVCVADGYVLLSDYKRSDSGPLTTPT